MRPLEPDLYAVLGVEPTANAEAIKQAYRRRVKELHPDHNPGRDDAPARLRAATDAYEVLKDAASRKAYDERRLEQPSRRAWADQLLGKLRPERGADLKLRLALDLEEIAAGVTRTVAVDRAEICDVCSGTGGRPGTQPVSCGTCGGRGSKGGWLGGGRCPTCRGAGRRFPQSCPVCAGSGRIRAKKRIEVRVPRGVEPGTRLRFPKEGDAGIDGGARGDLFVVVEQREHGLFRRQGLDLLVDLPLTVSEAVLGAELDVPTLEGREAVRVEPGTPPGREARWSGRGLVDEKGRSGDLIVRFIVELPTALTTEQRKAYERLRDLERAGAPHGRLERVRAAIAGRARS